MQRVALYLGCLNHLVELTAHFPEVAFHTHIGLISTLQEYMALYLAPPHVPCVVYAEHVPLSSFAWSWGLHAGGGMAATDVLQDVVVFLVTYVNEPPEAGTSEVVRM